MVEAESNSMTENEELNQSLDQVFDLWDAHLEGETVDWSFLAEQEEDHLSHLIEAVPSPIRTVIWHVIPEDKYWSVLWGLQADTLKRFVESFTPDMMEALRKTATPDYVRALAESLPPVLVEAILNDQEDEIADDIIEALSYDEGQVGRYTNKNILRVRTTMSVARLKRRLHEIGADGPKAIYVLTQNRELCGYITPREALLSSDDRPLSELYEPIEGLDHQSLIKDVCAEVEPGEDLCWYPVLKDGRVVGTLSLASVLWELQDQLNDTAVRDAPSAEEDLFTPVQVAAKSRALWLAINLVTAFLASWVIGFFEVALREVVALAILMPVVASMGGIAGSQTLAVALRGLALNHLTQANLDLVLKKEAKIAVLNGGILGVIIASIVGIWFDSIGLGAIIFAAIVINSLAAASSGTVIPFVLKKMNIDPAISGSVVLTTVTDIVGFLVFLGLGSVILVGQ